jgi:spore germination cell wall hydrolase CwlJ-like protein
MTSLNKKFFKFLSIGIVLLISICAVSVLAFSNIERNPVAAAESESMNSIIVQQLREQQAEEFRRVQLLNEKFEKDVQCLAKNIYYEAGNESRTGKIAVANVTLNRVKSGKFPKEVCAVVYQKHSGVCQFSWTCFKRNNRPSGEAYAESKNIAEMVLRNKIKPVIGKNVLYYHADYVDPNWDLQRVIKIGAHIFYTET